MIINFNIKDEDKELVYQIMARARREVPGMVYDEVECAMAITACHKYGVPLDLRKFLEFPRDHFAHDFDGIVQLIDTTTGQLRDHFLPRCALPESEYITCLVACSNSKGESELVHVNVVCDEAARNNGQHYAEAQDMVSDMGYDNPVWVADRLDPGYITPGGLKVAKAFEY